MVRRIREEIIDDDRPVVVEQVAPVTRRVVTERRTTGGYGFGYGPNPAMLLVAAVLVVFMLVLVFGR
jgi:hypothetical protein